MPACVNQIRNKLAMATAAPTTKKLAAAKLKELRQLYEKQQSARQNLRFDSEPSLPALGSATIPLSAAVQNIFTTLSAGILKERQRLKPDTISPQEPSVPPVVHSHEIPTPLKALALPIIGQPTLLPCITDTTINPAVNPSVLAFLQEEYAHLSSFQEGQSATPAAMLLKLRDAMGAYGEGRTADTITLLKNALNGDPHHQGLLACLGQVLYSMAANGVATALPEAREYAQRSMLGTERHRPARLEIYQYLAIIGERAFSTERTLLWLRSSGLLNPLPLQGTSGLLANRSATLRAWGVFATIPPSLWEDSEITQLKMLVSDVVGGAALYLHWLRPALLQYMAGRKVPNTDAKAIEDMLGRSWQRFEHLNKSLTNFPIAPHSPPWLIKVRFVNTMSSLMPTPEFDIILCNIALNAQRWSDSADPQREVQLWLDVQSFQYWRLWAQTLAGMKDPQRANPFPADEAALDLALLAEANTLVGMLHNLERQQIKAELWEELKPWLTRWQPEHLLAMATGSNQPRQRFAPSVTPFNVLYRKWQEPYIKAYLTSEVIAEVAKRGGFANWPEALTALEGALRLLDDPCYGLLANQQRALALAKQQFPEKFSKKFIQFKTPTSDMLALGLLPLGAVGSIFAAFTLSENLSQAVGITLVLLGLSGVIFLNRRQPPG